MRPTLVAGNCERIFRVAVQVRFRQDFNPLLFVIKQLLGRWQPVNRAGLQRTFLWIIAFEVGSIDYYAANNSCQPKPDDAPIESRGAASARFPTIHPLAEDGGFAIDENRHGRL